MYAVNSAINTGLFRNKIRAYNTKSVYITADSRLDRIIEIFDKLDKPLQDYLLTQSKELLKMQNEIKK